MDNEQLKALEAVNEEAVPTGDWSGKPAVPATTVAATNTSARGMFVEVTGGTVTAVKVDNVTVGARVSGSFYVRPGSTIALTYSAAPTWQWFSV
jgi:hypothetical protein